MSNGFLWGLIGSDVILNAVKNLSGCNNGCAIPEILRSAQDDRWGGLVGWFCVGFCFLLFCKTL